MLEISEPSSPYQDVQPLVLPLSNENFLWLWQMDISDSNDIEMFLEGVYLKIHDKLAKNLCRL